MNGGTKKALAILTFDIETGELVKAEKATDEKIVDEKIESLTKSHWEGKRVIKVEPYTVVLTSSSPGCFEITWDNRVVTICP